MKKILLFVAFLHASWITPLLSQEAIDPSISASLTPVELQEFQAWVAVGVGGLPHTLEGYRTLQRLNKMLQDPRNTTGISKMMGTGNDIATLGELPIRQGQKPSIAPFAIPHRQTDQHNSTEVRQEQVALFNAVVQRNATAVEFRKSYFEKHNDSVFLKDTFPGNRDILETTHSEIGHMHPSDGSMHMTLSPSDAKQVIEKGWGELHGLYGQVFNGKDRLSYAYMMIYAPRSREELVTTEKILEAAIAYAKVNKGTRK